MALSVRTRFEVFKRDGFTCQYCGKKSPEVILEVDHIVPLCEGGLDDVINLRTSCWECNRGKGGVPLNEIVTGEDPHDRSVLLLERERQLREYNEVLRVIRTRVEADYEDLCDFWEDNVGVPVFGPDKRWLMNALEKFPAETIRHAMWMAIHNRKMSSLAYVNAILKNQRERGEI